MKSVRPSIRALEMSFRRGVTGDDWTPWPEEFWRESWTKTTCIAANPDEDAKFENHLVLLESIQVLHAELTDHFISTIETTGIDARHDGSFGLAFHIIHLGYLALKGVVGQTLQGRIILRAAVEALITLSFLRADPGSS